MPHADAAANAGRSALLVAAFTTDPGLLLAATEDRLHQDYRAPVMPETATLVAALRAEGIPATVSGAGPSVLALPQVDASSGALRRAPAGWTARRTEIDTEGVRIDFS